MGATTYDGEYGNCGACKGPIEYEGDAMVLFPDGSDGDALFLALRCQSCGHQWIYDEDTGWYSDELEELQRGGSFDFRCNVQRPARE